MSMSKVLFVGNSHVYTCRMPDMLAALAAAAGHDLQTAESTGPGVSLEWHWSHKPTRILLDREMWDAVVLQERSGGPLEAPDKFRRYARLLDEKVQEHGARTVLYMTWARENAPETQETISALYRETADELGAWLAPVGRAWQRSLADRPGLRLHAPDGRHAGPAGAYLTACVFLGTLFQHVPPALPARLGSQSGHLASLDARDAEHLQNIARDTAV